MAVYEERKTVFTIIATCSTLYDNGMSYRGPVNYTSNGRACVDWQHHVHGVTPERYPYDGLEENYCRNPRGHQDAPWCYTSPENDGSKIWDYCPVRKCGKWSSKWKQRDVKWDLSAYEITRADSGLFLGGGGGCRFDQIALLCIFWQRGLSKQWRLKSDVAEYGVSDQGVHCLQLTQQFYTHSHVVKSLVEEKYKVTSKECEH